MHIKAARGSYGGFDVDGGGWDAAARLAEAERIVHEAARKKALLQEEAMLRGGGKEPEEKNGEQKVRYELTDQGRMEQEQIPLAEYAQFEEFGHVLGEAAPGSFAEFLKMKYDMPDEWKRVETLKQQTDFINAAECETTLKKFTGYFLKQGAKHSEDFFHVGYTADNPTGLRYDIAR